MSPNTFNKQMHTTMRYQCIDTNTIIIFALYIIYIKKLKKNILYRGTRNILSYKL